MSILALKRRTKGGSAGTSLLEAQELGAVAGRGEKTAVKTESTALATFKALTWSEVTKRDLLLPVATGVVAGVGAAVLTGGLLVPAIAFEVGFWSVPIFGKRFGVWENFLEDIEMLMED